MIFKTHISPVNCRRNPNAKIEITEIDVNHLKDGDGEINWFDRICDGGIHIPEDLGRDDNKTQRGHSVLMLLTGPPGTGKSTFALEFCARFIRAARAEKGPRPVGAFYVSGEESAPRLISKTVEFGWFPQNPQGIEQRFAFDFDDADSLKGINILETSSMIVMGKTTDETKTDENEIFAALAKKWLKKSEIVQQSFLHTSAPLDLLVLDSLNVLSPQLGPDRHSKTFDAIQRNIANPGGNSKNPTLILLILDAAADGEAASYWEYVSDIVFRFGWEKKCGYTQRTMTIAKMRGQSHAWGTQRLKIYPGPETDGGLARIDNSPFLSEGGIFVFPSMHWHLSVLERVSTKSGDKKPITYPLPRFLDRLNKQISAHKDFQGLPSSRCTALMGRRGGMKSHLAYYFLLDQAHTHNRNCLLLSFRDDIGAAKTTLSQIAGDQALAKKGKGIEFVEKLIDQDRLEIIEQEAGMISPEEFFHKIYVAVRRVRAQRAGLPESKNSGITPNAQVVVINGLDQLKARFPLIAEDEMFVTAVIEFLNLNGICSLVIAATGVDESPATTGLYGLLPMAELVLRFENFDPKCPPPGYKWPSHFPKALRDAVRKGTEHIVRVETQRVPAGQIGGKIGYLYRSTNNRLAYATK